jgi:hypothetical protein
MMLIEIQDMIISMLMIMSLIMTPMPVAAITTVMVIVKTADLRAMLITRTVTAMPDEMPVTLVSSARCAVCGGPLPRLAILAEDEFCSAECCRRAHQVPLGPGIRTAWPDDVMALLRKEDGHVDP